MNFFQVGLLGMVNSSREKPAPSWGFWAILVRFVPTSLTSVLALHLLGRTPFAPSYLTFLSTENYYAAEIFHLPAFGLAAWLLGGGVVRLCLRLTGNPSNFDWILNVIGFGLLIVMPAVWFLDWSAIALDVYGVGVSHPCSHLAVGGSTLWHRLEQNGMSAFRASFSLGTNRQRRCLHPTRDPLCSMNMVEWQPRPTLPLGGKEAQCSQLLHGRDCW